jgi:exopolysaccharide biosynthesis polyprenyl glycosylphosphotransferase
MTALRLGLLAVDAASASLLFITLSFTLLGTDWTGSWRRAGFDPFAIAAAYAATWAAVLWLHGLYRLRSRWSIRTEVRDILRADLLLAVATFSALFLFKLPDVSRRFLIALFLAQGVVTIALRLTIRLGLAELRDRGYNQRFVLMIGTGATALRFADRIERHRALGLRVIGHLALAEETPLPSALVGARPVIGTVDDIEEVLHGRVVDEVAICLGAEHVGLIEPITRLCEEEGKIVRIPMDVLDRTISAGKIEDLDGTAVYSLVSGPDRALALAVKRLIDVGVAAIGMVLVSPILLVAAVAIVVEDGRPVLFRQTRVGVHGRPFKVLKLRSMRRTAETELAQLKAHNEINGHAFKVSNDPRVTRVGRFLRRLSIDELPQFWNVLSGEMSLVGPRPPLPSEVQGYDLWHRRRLSMKPGITGLWQVRGRREAEFDRWVESDLEYIDRWSLWLDVKILFRTIPAAVQGR